VLVVTFVIALLTLGWEMAGAFTTELDAFERFGLAFGIGAGSFTLGVFLVSLL
jgi:hypothetical protein